MLFSLLFFIRAESEACICFTDTVGHCVEKCPNEKIIDESFDFSSIKDIIQDKKALHIYFDADFKVKPFSIPPIKMATIVLEGINQRTLYLNATGKTLISAGVDYYFKNLIIVPSSSNDLINLEFLSVNLSNTYFVDSHLYSGEVVSDLFSISKLKRISSTNITVLIDQLPTSDALTVVENVASDNSISFIPQTEDLFISIFGDNLSISDRLMSKSMNFNIANWSGEFLIRHTLEGKMLNIQNLFSSVSQSLKSFTIEIGNSAILTFPDSIWPDYTRFNFNLVRTGPAKIILDKISIPLNIERSNYKLDIMIAGQVVSIQSLAIGESDITIDSSLNSNFFIGTLYSSPNSLLVSGNEKLNIFIGIINTTEYSHIKLYGEAFYTLELFPFTICIIEFDKLALSATSNWAVPFNLNKIGKIVVNKNITFTDSSNDIFIVPTDNINISQFTNIKDQRFDILNCPNDITDRFQLGFPRVGIRGLSEHNTIFEPYEYSDSGKKIYSIKAVKEFREVSNDFCISLNEETCPKDYQFLKPENAKDWINYIESTNIVNELRFHFCNETDTVFNFSKIKNSFGYSLSFDAESHVNVHVAPQFGTLRTLITKNIELDVADPEKWETDLILSYVFTNTSFSHGAVKRLYNESLSYIELDFLTFQLISKIKSEEIKAVSFPQNKVILRDDVFTMSGDGGNTNLTCETLILSYPDSKKLEIVSELTNSLIGHRNLIIDPKNVSNFTLTGEFPTDCDKIQIEFLELIGELHVETNVAPLKMTLIAPNSWIETKGDTHFLRVIELEDKINISSVKESVLTFDEIKISTMADINYTNVTLKVKRLDHYHEGNNFYNNIPTLIVDEEMVFHDPSYLKIDDLTITGKTKITIPYTLNSFPYFLWNSKNKLTKPENIELRYQNKESERFGSYFNNISLNMICGNNFDCNGWPISLISESKEFNGATAVFNVKCANNCLSLFYNEIPEPTRIIESRPPTQKVSVIPTEDPDKKNVSIFVLVAYTLAGLLLASIIITIMAIIIRRRRSGMPVMLEMEGVNETENNLLDDINEEI